MKLSLDQQRQANNQSWNWAIRSGRENFGNHEVNLRFLEKTGLLKSGLKALELGCGTAALTQELHLHGLDVIGCDISEVAIQHARKKYPHLELSVQNAEQLPWNNEQFDLVLSFDVLEHLFEPDRHLSEVYRTLKPNGVYLLQTPNKWPNRIYETLSSKSLDWRRYHPSLHSAGQLRRRLVRHGFDVRFIKMNTVNEFTLKKLSRMAFLRFIFRHLNFESLPLRLQTNFYVAARKRIE